MRKLNQRQKAFADYYLQTGNATESALKAGYSKNTASETGYENLNKPHIRAYIDERAAKSSNERIASADEVLEFLSQVMRGEIKDQFDLDPSLSDRINASKELFKRYRLGDKEDKTTKNYPNIIVVRD